MIGALARDSLDIPVAGDAGVTKSSGRRARPGEEDGGRDHRMSRTWLPALAVCSVYLSFVSLCQQQLVGARHLHTLQTSGETIWSVGGSVLAQCWCTCTDRIPLWSNDWLNVRVGLAIRNSDEVNNKKKKKKNWWLRAHPK